MVSEQAYAKINLSLTVHGRRADGYHTLESLTAFAPAAADTLEVRQSNAFALTANGAFAHHLPANIKDNLVWQAAEIFARHEPQARNITIRLVKNLPAAAGLGSGSADAAALLRVLAGFFPRAAKPESSRAGSDTPACVYSRALLMRGRGEIITPARLPENLWAVIIAPDFALPTAHTYRALKAKPAPFLPPPACANFASIRELANFLASHPNQLEKPAIRLRPAIGEMLRSAAACAGDPITLRMTGSGPACFALYHQQQPAQHFAAALKRRCKQWTVFVSPIV